jgi:hypothetical protein
MAVPQGHLSSRLELSFTCNKCVFYPFLILAELTTRARRTALSFSLADAGFMDKSDPCVLVYLRYSAIDEWQLQGRTGATSSQQQAPTEGPDAPRTQRR